VRGLREVEGIQEFFLIVNQPEDRMIFALTFGSTQAISSNSASWNTISNRRPRLSLSPIYTDQPDADIVVDSDTTRTLVSHNNDIYTYRATVPYHCYKRTRQNSTTYKPTDSDYIIDVANLSNQPNNLNGFHVLTPNTQVNGNATYSINVTPDGEFLTINIEATSRACFKGGINEISLSSTVTASEAVLIALAASTVIGNPLGPIAASILATGASVIATFEAADTAVAYANAPGAINQELSSANVELQVFLRSREKILDTGRKEKTFFITTRGLCCCGEQEGPTLQDGIVFIQYRI
jgi:hypothetical protein